MGPINSVAEALASPQTNARQMVVDLQLETGLATRGLGLPFQFSDTPSSIRRPPPALGADTRELLLELGLSDAEIDDLERRRVI